VAVTFADVASGVAAGASVLAVLISGYIARYQGTAAARLERTRWARAELATDINHAIALLDTAKLDMRWIELSKKPKDLHRVGDLAARMHRMAKDLSPLLAKLENQAPDGLSNAAKTLASASMSATMLINPNEKLFDVVTWSTGKKVARHLVKASDEFRKECRKTLGVAGK
jgi:hypothetical protein